MKFLLFDLLVVASFAVAVRRLLGYRPRPAPECQGGDDSANRTCAMEQQRQPAGPADGAAVAGVGESEAHHQPAASEFMPGSNTPSSPEDELDPGATTAQYPPDEDKPNYLRIGSRIELYGDPSMFAMPATIVGYDESSDKYILQDFIRNSRLPGISPEFIHPYRVYEVGTEAHCNIGMQSKREMVPCKVVSSRSAEQMAIEYQVSFTNEKMKLPPTYLPFFEVIRIHNNMPGSDTASSSEGKLDSRATIATQYPRLIELYGDTSRFAIPAIVAGYDESSNKFSLHDVVNDLALTEISPEFIHPYGIYEAGTEAHCNIGGKDEAEMVPCTVVSARSVERVGFIHIQYQVSFTGGRVKPFGGARLPYFRVMRIHNKE